MVRLLCVVVTCVDANLITIFRNGRPLWNYETVTSKQKELRSVTDMRNLIGQLLVVFKHTAGPSLIHLRWCQTSLQFAMNCTSRHYAGRSLQVRAGVLAFGQTYVYCLWFCLVPYM